MIHKTNECARACSVPGALHVHVQFQGADDTMGLYTWTFKECGFAREFSGVCVWVCVWVCVLLVAVLVVGLLLLWLLLMLLLLLFVFLLLFVLVLFGLLMVYSRD
jgi:hypothetical protein